MALLISRKARDKYKFDQSFFEPSGDLEFPDFQAVRHFARQLESSGARAGHINAMSLIHKIYHHMVNRYKHQENPQTMENALEWLEETIDPNSVDTTLRIFTKEFPPPAVYNGESTAENYMQGESEGTPHRQILLEKMMMLRLANENPGFKPYKKELFDDAKLENHSHYKQIIKQLELFFDTQPQLGPGKVNRNLLALLRGPARENPGSLREQLTYIREHWEPHLGNLLLPLLKALDFIGEEEKTGLQGPGETPVYDFDAPGKAGEQESFSPDLDWMPRLVLIAKSTHVWLDQLSKKHRTPISRLDQIPGEELDALADQGFTGLWLIGLWERSRASQKIKQLCGNPEAMASAYSIYDYRIAENLGGEEALYNLEHRARQRGIRLAGDMVPNHMGIDSPWLVEHPDWFLSLDYCPFPAYTFNGPDLSSDPDHRVSIFLEDHYYDRSDAAVVFKRVDNRSGEVRYIYHGNDGTSMPWNDTAQLNYLNPEAREAVTGAIFSVAGKFPIIRFDAAMTLTKKHYRRLWFPEPGSGGDIPSRAGSGMTPAEFQRNMPEEFWRQVVDRFAEAQPGTLLMAEAFWLMETYFVRTLGMHRVYNSAFMNFLENEENGKFRTAIKNVLQFNREILKRFVNFMNNPDEETAAVQFGKGDKYIGVCTLMVTLPGLPMFGHGQIEGMAEKYGMEYSRAYRDEAPDQHLVQRHEQEIFPLLRQRYLFAEVENFLFYDFRTGEAKINEDVIAFSNRVANESSLVVYHNKYAETAGWIKTSAPFPVKNSDGETLCRKNLAEGLGLRPGANRFVIFRDHASGLEYIRDSRELFEKGLYVELKAFKRSVFLDFRQVEDTGEGIYSQLAVELKGKGAVSIEDALRTVPAPGLSSR